MLPRAWMEAYIRFLLHYRWLVLTLFLVVTLFLGSHLSRRTIQTNFLNFFPSSHPYLRFIHKYAPMFGSANILVVGVEVKEGDIFTVETLNKIDRLTTTLLQTPGVNPQQVLSLSHPRVCSVKVSSVGIRVLPIFFPGPPKELADVARIKRAVYTTDGIFDFFVSRDSKTAFITVGFWESGLDFARIQEWLFRIQARESDANHEIHMTGLPMLSCWISRYTSWMFGMTILTVLSSMVFLWWYFRTLQGVLIPLVSGALSMLGALGFAGSLGFTLDPLMAVVVLLLSARVLSHSVQFLGRYCEEYCRLGDQQAAILQSSLGVFSPALVSIASDGLAVLSLAFTSSAALQMLAITASFWIVTITLSVVTLHPVILSFLLPPPRAKAGQRLTAKISTSIIRTLAMMSHSRMRPLVAAGLILALLIGISYSRQLTIGDLSIGQALFSTDHPYNVAYERITEKGFVGLAELTIIAEGREPGAFRQLDVLNSLERFQRYMERHNTAAGGSISVVDMVRQLHRLFEEGIPKWAVLPSKVQDTGKLFGILFMNSSVSILERFVDKDRQNAAITIYFRDSTNKTITGALARAKEYIAANPTETITFRLAGGQIGMLAALNEEVEWLYRVNLSLVLAALFLLSVLLCRSLIRALVVMIPLTVAFLLIAALTSWVGIGVNVNSLPVVAIGIGIGINYSHYLLSRITEEHAYCPDIDRAIEKALMTTGRTILFTGATLLLSVTCWLFFPMKFQTDMAFLLIGMFLLQVVGTVVCIPLVVPLFKFWFATAGKEPSIMSVSAEPVISSEP